MLWGINWMNAQMILADAARMKHQERDENGKIINDPEKPDVHRELKTKEDIKNYIKAII